MIKKFINWLKKILDQLEWSFKKRAIKFAVENTVKHPKLSKFILEKYKDEIFLISKFFIKRDIKKAERWAMEQLDKIEKWLDKDSDKTEIKYVTINGKKNKIK